MIHYQLQCDNAHAFDGWFKDSASFDDQADTGLIACPSCSSVRVTRALMAPALGRGSRSGRGRDGTTTEELPVTPAPNLSNDAGPAVASAVTMAETAMPDRLRAMLQRLRSEVERGCEYVGTGFADEARRIHNGESKVRGIYGETTPSEAEALADEGIEFGVVPWIQRADS